MRPTSNLLVRNRQHCIQADIGSVAAVFAQFAHIALSGGLREGMYCHYDMILLCQHVRRQCKIGQSGGR